PEVAVVDLAFLEEEVAANDEIAGNGVALELDSRDGELLAFVDVDVPGDGVLRVVEGWIGRGTEVDVAVLAISLAKVIKVLLEEGQIEDRAVFLSEQGAESFG